MLIVGQMIGGWSVDDLVSLGVPRTYRAHDLSGDLALLKVTAWSPQGVEAQRRELAALRELSHPGVTAILDAGADRDLGIVWTAFAWVDAESLLDRLQAAGPL